MRFVLSTARKDWQRLRRDRIAIAMWIGVPLIIGGLLTSVAGGNDGPAPKAHVLVVDEDDSFVSGLLQTSLGQMGGLIETEELPRDEARERIDAGDATAMLIIPAGFGEAMLLEQPTTLQLVTNPSQTILPGIVEETLSIVVDASFYLQRLIGDDLKTIAQGPTGGDTFSDQSVAETSVRINRLVGRLQDYLFPPVISLEATVDEDPGAEEEQPITVAMLFLPGILFMSLLFIAQGLSTDLWKEREGRTLARIVMSPQTALSFLVGKLAAGAWLILIVCTITLAVGFWYLGFTFRVFPLSVLWAVLSGAVLTLMMMVIQVFSSSQRAGGVVSLILVFPLMMAGGSFFPFEAMPEWMASIGRLTPNGWALEQLKDIMFDRLEVASFAKAIAGQIGVALVLFMISARRMRSRFAQG